MNEDNLIKFKAQVAKVQTLSDGGLRIILDLPENAIRQAGELMKVKQSGAFLEVIAVPIIIDPLTQSLQVQA